MKKLLIVAASLLAAGFLFSACQSQASGSEPVTRDFNIIMGEGEIVSEHEHEGEEVQEIVGEFHRWEPAVLIAFKGDTIRLNVENPRGSTHSLILDEFLVDTELLEIRGGTKTVEFVVDKAGIFQYACGLEWEDEDTGELTGECDADHKRMVGYFIVLDR